MCRNGRLLSCRRVGTNPDAVDFLNAVIVRAGELHVFLRRNHVAAIVDCPFQQEIPRIRLVLRFHIDDNANQVIILRDKGIESNVIEDSSFGYSFILGIAALDAWSVFVYINTHADDRRCAFAVVVHDVLNGAIPIFG